MQAGLLKVVPQAVLDLFTWQELEKKVCGDPEVTVDALKKLSKCRGCWEIVCGTQLLAVAWHPPRALVPWPGL